MSVAPREDRTKLGIAMMAAAALCFTGIDTSAKWLLLSGLPPLQVVFARYAGHFLLSVVLFVPRGGLAAFRSARPRLQALRSLTLLLSTILNFVALIWLPLTLTTTILFAIPLAVMLLSIPVLGERVGPLSLAAAGLGFCGVLVAVQPWGAEFHPAILLSLGGLLSAAAYFVLTRLLAGIESNATSQLWASGLAALAIAPFALRVWVWPETVAGYLVLALVGAFGAIGHSLATAALRFAGASVLAPVTYLQLIYASTAGYLVFATLPTPWTLVGAVIIVTAGLLLWRAGSR